MEMFIGIAYKNVLGMTYTILKKFQDTILFYTKLYYIILCLTTFSVFIWIIVSLLKQSLSFRYIRN